MLIKPLSEKMSLPTFSAAGNVRLMPAAYTYPTSTPNRYLLSRERERERERGKEREKRRNL